MGCDWLQSGRSSLDCGVSHGSYYLGTKEANTEGVGGYLAKAGIRNFRWHDFRHTFASQLVMKGVPLYTVQGLLGHSTIEMTARYSHLPRGHYHDAVWVLLELLERELTPDHVAAAGP